VILPDDAVSLLREDRFMKIGIHHLVVCLLGAGLLLCAGSTAATERDSDHRIVSNGSQPLHGTERWQLEEIWQAGNEDDDVFFGLITQALVDEAGAVYLLDAQLAHIEVFSSLGDHLRTIGGPGEGPGEFRMPFDMAFLPDGNLAVAEAFPGRLDYVTPEGSPVRTCTPRLKDAADGGWIGLFNCFSTDAGLVLSCQDVSMGENPAVQFRTYFVGGFDREGSPGVRYHEVQKEIDFRDGTMREVDLEFIWNRLAVDGDGRVAIGIPREDYEITLYRRDGSIDRVIRRQYESLRRDAATSALYTAWIEGIASSVSNQTEAEACAYNPDIQGLRFDEDGNLWSLPGRAVYDAADGVLAEYDVFDRKGEYTRRIQIIADGNPDQDILLFPGNGLVYRVTGYRSAFLTVTSNGGFVAPDSENAEPMRIVCYRVASQGN
jgi:hypothetical protein